MKNMTVSSRLCWGFGVQIALLAVIALVALLRLASVSDLLDAVVSNRAPKLEALNDMMFRSMDNTRIVRNLVVLTDPPTVEQNLQAFANNTAANAEHLAFLKTYAPSTQEIALIRSMDEHRQAYKSYTKAVLDLIADHQIELAITTLYGERSKTQDAYFEAIRQFTDFEKNSMQAAGLEARTSVSSARTIVVGIGLLACVIGLALAVMITRGLVRQLGGEPGYAASVTHRIAAGDLASEVRLDDGDNASLLFAMKSMQDSLANVVSHVRQGSMSVATASAQIAQGNLELSGRTEQQASALEQTAASMEQLGSTVRQNAENARQANQLSVQASAVAIKGGDVVAKVVDTIKEINESSTRIGDIIGVIDSIAFQTNILALNAAVEAARAGEQGRGFAVVASEVRSLAQRSAAAAKEIKILITASIERVACGSLLADQAGNTMREVVTAIGRVTDMMGEISSASREQDVGVAQVGEAVTQMDRATQQNSALVEESAAAAESLRDRANELVQAVALFKLAT